MANFVKVVGLDPAFKNFGVVQARIDLDSLEVTIDGMSLIETQKGADTKKVVRKSSDNLRRAQEISRKVGPLIAGYGARFVISEIPAGAKSAAASHMLGIAVGILGSLPVPIIEVTAFEAKIALTGDKNAPKDAMIMAASAAQPTAGWLTMKRKGETVLLEKNEHLADAYAVILAGVMTTEFQRSMALLRSIAA